MTVWEYVTLFILPAAGAFFGSYLKKKGENLATHEDIDKLVTQVSAVTVATKQIEAKITRASRVYERQLDILGKLYRLFFEAQVLFQRMTATGRLAGEKTPEEYQPLVTAAMKAAYEGFLDGRLFIPLSLVQLCEDFFTAASQGELKFAIFSLYPIAGRERADLWDAAAKIAHQQLPNILRQIDDTARGIIHD
ncbi:MAG: hypothetical protein ABSC63_16915 [Candidatus Binataceae bacterium]|jgi:hypothetical protein